MPDELHPRSPGLYLNQFEDAYELHNAAGAVRMFYNRTDVASGFNKADEKARSRMAILDIAFKLIILERDRLLDEFCVAWLKHRDLPIPEKDHAPTGTLGVQGSQGTDGPVRPEDRGDQGGSNTLHDSGSTPRTQPPGGITVP